MKIVLATVLPRRSQPTGPVAALLQLYLTRCARYLPTEAHTFPSEAKLLSFCDEASARTRPFVALTDSSGEPLTSPQFAAALSRTLDAGTQRIVLAIGPPDGWSPTALRRAELTLAFGRITLPHELAAVIAAEQLYRALTIRAGHPYHTGH